MATFNVSEILIAVGIAMAVICIFLIGCVVLLIYKFCEICHDG